MSDGTHRVVGKRIYRHDGYAEVGDRITPTAAERRAFSDRLEAVTDDDDDEAEDEVAPEPDPEPERTDAEIDAILAGHVEDPTDYGSLREAASEIEGVPASRVSKAELRQKLADALA